MAARAVGGEDKRELALAVAEVFAYLARMRGDIVALVAGDEADVVDRPARSGAEHAEMLLALLSRRMQSLTDDDGRPVPGAPASRLSAVLQRVSTWHRRRSLVILITDTAHPDAADDPAVVDWLRRLSAQHEVIAVQVADAPAVEPGGERRQDVELEVAVPAFLREDRRLADTLAREEERRRHAVGALLSSRRIERVVVTSDAEMVDQIADLLSRQRLVASRKRR